MNNTTQDLFHGSLEIIIDYYRKLYESEENRRRLNRRGTKYMILPEFPLLSMVTGFQLGKTYVDPENFLRFILSQRIYRFERWKDCTPLTKDIAYWPGVILETSILGMTPNYLDNQDPWIDHNPVIHNLDDVDKLSGRFDPSSNVTQKMLEISEYCRKMLPDFKVYVQSWDRAALGIAFDLVGTEEYLIKTIDAPEFIHAIMERITVCSYEWMEGRDQYLKAHGFLMEASVSPGTGAGADELSTFANIISDELNKPMISIETYEQFIHPYELKSVKHCGGLNYYHSCGCINPFLDRIKQLQPLTQHISAWTDLKSAVETFAGTKTCIQKTLHPLRDVLEQDKIQMKSTLNEIKHICQGVINYSVIANGIEAPTNDINGTLKKCDDWVTVAEEVFS